MDEAEARAHSLKTQIAARKEELETGRAKLQATQDEIDRIAFEIATVRQKLPVLADGLHEASSEETIGLPDRR